MQNSPKYKISDSLYDLCKYIKSIIGLHEGVILPKILERFYTFDNKTLAYIILEL